MSDSSSGFTYRAFISYSHRDKAWADWLHKALETYRVPSRLVGQQNEAGIIPRRLNPVFRDREELASAADLGRTVNAALAKSENLVVICSPASAASRWVNEEVLAYKRMGRGERIFCMIVGGVPEASDMSGREAEECFCPALRFQLDANGQLTSERTEPIAADARAGKDGKTNARLKLIAGVLGVGFDALKQRELQRRTHRMTAIAVLALVVMAGTSALAAYALISRHAAVIAKQQAVVAQQAAQRRQKQAESLVDFMLGDLTAKLQAESRTDIMLSVDDKAMAYFISLPPTDVSETALVQRANALELIGTVRQDQGQLAGAIDAYGASAAISFRLAAAAPNDTERQVAYSRTVTYIGLIYQLQGKLTDAQHEYEVARRTLQSSLKRTPSDLDLVQQLSYIENNLGQISLIRGQLQAATDDFESFLQLSQRLVTLPNTAAYAENLIAGHYNLAKVALQSGNLATAIAQCRAAIAAWTRVNKRHPTGNQVRFYLVLVYGKLGSTSFFAGDSQGGMRNSLEAVKVATEVVKIDPKNSSIHGYQAKFDSQLARLQRLSGDFKSANASIKEAIGILSKLTRDQPGNVFLQQYLAEAWVEQARQLRASGRVEAARTDVQNALRALKVQRASHPNDREVLLAYASAKLLLASLTSEPKAAKGLRDQALNATQDTKFGQADPRLLALQVKALLALGLNTDAQPLIKQLWSEGYRDAGFVDLLKHERIAYPANPAFKARLRAETRRVDAANAAS